MKLKELRILNDLTQAQLAKKIGITQFTYCNYENGKTQPDFDILIKLANLYNVSLDYLLGRTFINDLEVSHLPTEKKEAIKLLLNLNQLNFVKAVSYMSGLYAGQN